MQFRVASMADLPRLQELEQAVVEAERPFNQTIKSDNAIYYDLEDLITSEKAHLLLVEADGEIVATGYAQIRDSKKSLKHEKHSYLGFMYVSPDFRGKGLNGQIIERLINWSKSKGMSDCYLDVYSENESAIKAYEKVGFKSSMVEMKLSF